MNAVQNTDKLSFIVLKELRQSVLQQVIEVMKYLCERGLALLGNDEIFGTHLDGNFLELLDLVAKFDPFLAEHINRYGNKGPGNPSLFIINSM